MNNIRQKINPLFTEGTGLSLEERIQNLIQEYKDTLDKIGLKKDDLLLLHHVGWVRDAYENSGMDDLDENFNWGAIHRHKFNE